MKKVYSLRSGELLGKIIEIVNDSFTGHPSYAVIFIICSGADEGKYYTIPYNCLLYDKDLGIYYLNIAKDKLLNAPSFDKEKLPLIPDKNFISEIYSYYGSIPYWK
jgi:hypothetical protein